MGYKAVETTCNINNAFGPGTVNKSTVQWWFKKFCKGDKHLEDEECSGRPSEVDNDQLSGSSKLILLQPHKEFSKNSALTILWSFGIWSKLEMCKCSKSGCLMNWQQIKKNHYFEVSSSLILFNSKSFLKGIVMCDVKWILYNWRWPAQWLDQEEAPKHFPKPNLEQKKVMVSVWWFAATLIHYSFLNPSETITSEKSAQQINKMCQKLQCLQLT